MKNARIEIERAFEEFWAMYPRKVAKLAAKKKFAALKPTPELVAKIRAALAWQAPQWTDLQFVPYPATWLNQGRWEDEPPTSPRPTASKPAAFDNTSRCQHDPKCGSPHGCSYYQKPAVA